MPQTKTYTLLFSDIRMGCDELGWIPRDLDDPEFDVDDEDLAYRCFLKKQGIDAQVYEGIAVVTVQVQP